MFSGSLTGGLELTNMVRGGPATPSDIAAQYKQLKKHQQLRKLIPSFQAMVEPEHSPVSLVSSAIATSKQQLSKDDVFLVKSVVRRLNGHDRLPI